MLILPLPVADDSPQVAASKGYLNPIHGLCASSKSLSLYYQKKEQASTSLDSDSNWYPMDSVTKTLFCQRENSPPALEKSHRQNSYSRLILRGYPWPNRHASFTSALYLLNSIHRRWCEELLPLLLGHGLLPCKKLWLLHFWVLSGALEPSITLHYLSAYLISKLNHS